MSSTSYLSYSQMADYLRCRYKWDARYRRRLKPVIRSRAPELGDAVHRCIASGLRGEDPAQGFQSWKEDYITSTGRKSLFDEEIQAIDDLEEDCEATVARAMEYIRNSGLTTEVWNGVPMIEQRIVFPLKGWKGFVGIFDWVARDENGYVWLVDWKVRSSFQQPAAEEVSFQMATYQAVAHIHGYPVSGSRILQIRPGQPAVPVMTQKGTISKGSITTDWNTYKKAVQDAGLDLADYADMYEKLSATKWQEWILSYRSPTEVASVWNDIVVPLSKEMRYKRVQATRNLNFFTCMNCDVRELCLADLRGHDTEYLIKELFENESVDVNPERLIKWRKTR